MTERPNRSQKAEIIMPDQYADRRAEPRFACDDRGALLFLSTRQIVPCRIMDQSASGARVSLAAIGDLPAQMWLIDLDQNTVRCGTAAWAMPNRMGLKFSFVASLKPGEARPAKVPQEVYDAWKRLTDQKDPPDQADDDVVYFD
ncbi:hypothetical protein [Asticcacaulis sp. AC402]|uniref:hypothetical protein n=1 Tax=Asticcacaulis sp. AC402 TaxID=1282361 RepID=UPI0003C3B113|nr:hypothetical protein [Asticcacaulis sp. AC402]ESQ77232.1 hypothetical protein ABAC402_02175 [Asticcacaulis sp. AC402]